MTGEIKIHDILAPYEGLSSYQTKVTSFIKKHKNFLVINKIKNNQPITGEELELIKDLLFKEDPDTASHLEEA